MAELLENLPLDPSDSYGILDPLNFKVCDFEDSLSHLTATRLSLCFLGNHHA